ncbi:class I SAM-dependent methyltransferase [Pseudooceanicola sp. LIPI14-2-Ac024]|uniref:class I SAM-dependent methyltransferase n=1 Tax=Pseudooceanicola sp. LIPI14-2-Ac024 TaxID=3344875 RepID=UPI0035CF94F3
MGGDGWESSAEAWVESLGTAGDFGRQFVLDAPMLARVRDGGFARMLDVGCGEGRFCRMTAGLVAERVGLDPTAALLGVARGRDPEGRYVEGRAEALPFEAGAFDLVVSYLTLIDIPDIDVAIPEMARVLAPGGALLIANLNAFATAAAPEHRVTGPDGRDDLRVARYFEERAEWAAWRGIRIVNHHRPMARYMGALLAAGLQLVHFDEPAPQSGPPERVARYREAPWFHLMEWRKPV